MTSIAYRRAEVKIVFALFALFAIGACHREQYVTLKGTPNVRELPNYEKGARYDCDAAGGFGSVWSQKADASGHVTGSVFMRAIRVDARWDPTITVYLRAADIRRGVSLVLTVDWRAEKLLPEVIYKDSTVALRPAKQPLRPRPLSGVAFDMKWEPGMLHVRIEPNQPWLDVPLGFAPDRIGFQCSSGNAIFYSVAFAPNETPRAEPIAAPTQPD
jgi:hypothetical protein